MKAKYEFDEALHPLGKETCDVAYQNYLRAYYAGCALTGLLGDYKLRASPKEFSTTAFEHADAMLAELNKKNV